MDYLRQGINLRAYAQKDPKQEYKREAFQLFNDLLARLKHEVIATLSKVRVQAEADVEAVEAQRRAQAEALQARGQASHAEADNALAAGEAPPQSGAQAPAGARRIQAGPAGRPAAPPPRPATVERTERKVGRNEPCPCGSGKKYKQCHGRVA